MFSDAADAIAGLAGLKTLLAGNLDEPGTTFHVAYNQNEGLLAQVAEVVIQKDGGVEAVLDLLDGDYHEDKLGPELKQAIGEISRAIAWSSDDDLATQVAEYRKWLAQGRRVVVVSHSQGNFYTNAAWSRLSEFPGTERFTSVAVANPASEVASGGANVTFCTDYVFLAVSAAWAMDPEDGVTQPDDCDPGLGLPGKTAPHGFVDTYLANAKSASAILSAVVSQHASLAAPEPHDIRISVTTASVAVATVTLVRPDSQSVADTAAGATVSEACDALEVGEYRVFLQADPTSPLTLLIEAGDAQVTLNPTAHSSNDTLVARVVVSEVGTGFAFEILLEAAEPTGCPSGTGYYCGQTVQGILALNEDILYWCAAGLFTEAWYCGAGSCVENSPGEQDECAPGSCASDEFQCGSALGLSPTTLYQCQQGALSAEVDCPSGCIVNAGPDTCIDPQLCDGEEEPEGNANDDWAQPTAMANQPVSDTVDTWTTVFGTVSPLENPGSDWWTIDASDDVFGLLEPRIELDANSAALGVCAYWQCEGPGIAEVSCVKGWPSTGPMGQGCCADAGAGIESIELAVNCPWEIDDDGTLYTRVHRAGLSAACLQYTLSVGF